MIINCTLKNRTHNYFDLSGDQLITHLLYPFFLKLRIYIPFILLLLASTDTIKAQYSAVTINNSVGINASTGGVWTTSGSGATLLYTFTPNASTATVSVAEIQNILTGTATGTITGGVSITASTPGSVTIKSATSSGGTSTGSITVGSAITAANPSTSNSYTLTLNASGNGNVTISSAINLTGKTNSGLASTALSAGGLGDSVVVKAGPSNTVSISAAITTTGGVGSQPTTGTTAGGNGGIGANINISGPGGITITTGGILTALGGNSGAANGNAAFGNGGNGGKVILSAVSGAISISGSAVAILTSGGAVTSTSGSNGGSGANGSSGNAGIVDISASGNISIGANTGITAIGGNNGGCNQCATVGAGGTGNTVTINSSGGTVTVSAPINTTGGTGGAAKNSNTSSNGGAGGAVNITASGSGGISLTSTITTNGGIGGPHTNGGNGSPGTGGTAGNITFAGASVSTSGALSATGGTTSAGNGGTGGAGGSGGIVSIGTSGTPIAGSITIGSTITTNAAAGTNASNGVGGNGGNAGAINIYATGNIQVNTSSAISAIGGGSGSASSSGVGKPGGTGANITVNTTGGTITLNSLLSSAGGNGGSPACCANVLAGTSGTGGNINVTATGNISITAGLTSIPGTTPQSGSSSNGATGGNAGNITVNSSSGSVSITSVAITATGGTGGQSGSNGGLTGGTGGTGGTISITGSNGITCTQNITATRGSGGTGTGASGSNGTGGDITITDGAATVTTGGSTNDGISGIISGRNFTSSGSGKLKLTGVNTYTGTTTVNNGTVIIGTQNTIPTNSNMVLNSGFLSTSGGVGDATTNVSSGTNTLGTLTLTGNCGIILGNTAHSIKFANSSGVTWTSATLNITNWATNPSTTGTYGKFFVGTLSSHLIAGQLAVIYFNGNTCSASAYLTPVTGEVVPTVFYTLTGASFTSPCVNSTTTINLTGLASGTFAAGYTIGSSSFTSSSFTPASGSASFTSTTITAAMAGQAITITSLTLGGCTQTFNVAAGTLTSKAYVEWLNTGSTTWDLPSNWCGGIPSATDSVVITNYGGSASYPIITTGVAALCKGISIQTNAAVTINSGGSLTVSGIYTSSGTFTNNGDLNFNGTYPQVFPGATGSVSAQNNITINNAAGITFNNNFSISGALTPSSGIVNLNNAIVTILSTVSKTARVGVVGSTAGFSYTGTGKFCVERYMDIATTISARRWHLLTVPFKNDGNAETVRQAWQENATPTTATTDATNSITGYNPNPGYGTHITKSTIANGPTDGYDVGSTNNPSMYYIKPGGVIGTNVQYHTLTNTDTIITSKEAFMIFVRGDRSIQISNQYITAKPTTLRAKGYLYAGDTTKTLLPYFNVLGNPYASAIHVDGLTFHGQPYSTSGYTLYLFDPKVVGGSTNPVGKFIEVTSDGNGEYTIPLNESGYDELDPIIQSGVGFGVYSQSAPHTFGFHEADKETSSSNIGLSSRPVGINKVTKIYTTMYALRDDNSLSIADAVANTYSPTYENEVNEKDAIKLASFNVKEGLSILSNGKELAVEKRKLPNQNDTIFLLTKLLSNKTYQFKFRVQNFSPSLNAYLEDKYTGTSMPIDVSGNNTGFYNFTIDNSNAASADINRFKIVFRRSSDGPLPVKFVDVKATQLTDKAEIKIEWNIADEINTKEYIVERSDDGINFTQIAIVNVGGNGVYNWIDKDIQSGANFYRIISIGINAEKVYSKIVSVRVSSLQQPFAVYPNPIKNNVINLYMHNKPTGLYSIRLLNSIGQIMFTDKFYHTESNQAEIIKHKNNLARGIYHLEIVGPDNTSIILKVTK
ncbi:beta strand repeat-containing protein [Ferruginibacter sp. SUN002]|uniref:beta strand repeat-containing protein n=1 Tax=Ferruginibacter sp. SUN002 TaxID=2937789 RepID=UPI003D36124E